MQRVGASSSSVATSFVMVEPDESLASRSSSSGVAARRSGSATDQIEEVEYVEEEVEEEVEVEEEEELDEQAAAVQDPAASTTSGGNQERTKSATISQPVTEDTKRSSNEAATQPPAPANKQPQPTTDEITPSTTAEEATLDKPGAATSRPAPAQAAGDDAFAAFGNFEASFISKMQALRSTVTSTLHHLADSTPDTASAARSDGAAAAAPQQQAASGSSAAFSTSITKQLGGLTSGLGELASSWWGAAAVGVAGGSGADNVARPQEELQAQFGISDTEQVVDAFRCKLVQVSCGCGRSSVDWRGSADYNLQLCEPVDVAGVGMYSVR